MNSKGVLLINLGSPDSTSVPDVRTYLKEFLMDKRVIDAPLPIRVMIVYGMILPRRPKQSAEAYEKIWRKEGSPLVVTSFKVRKELQQRIRVPVELAMRYRNPSIEQALKNLDSQGVRELLLIPLFPHYAMSSYETAVVRVKEVLAMNYPHLKLHVTPPYYQDFKYIEALAQTAQPFLEKPYDHLLFSFHGIPERHLHKTDPGGDHCLKCENCCEGNHPAHATCYRAQCFKTVKALVQRVGTERYSVAFQSRLGRDPWLQPYTDREIARLAKEGAKRLLVICPAFVADCLETIEEIGMRGREIFLEHGGETLELIPCLNDHPAWLDALESFAQRFLESESREMACSTSET